MYTGIKNVVKKWSGWSECKYCNVELCTAVIFYFMCRRAEVRATYDPEKQWREIMAVVFVKIEEEFEFVLI